MAKGFPNLAIGYGTRTGVVSKPGMPIAPTGTAGTALATQIRKDKGWGK